MSFIFFSYNTGFYEFLLYLSMVLDHPGAKGCAQHGKEPKVGFVFRLSSF